MPGSLSPSQILARDRDAAQRLVQGAGKARTRSLLQRAQLQLERRLKTAEGLTGPGKGSFTAVQLRATLLQVKAVTAQLNVGIQGLVLEQGAVAAERSALNAARYLRTAEARFSGSTERLQLDTVKLVERATAGTESSLLNRLLNGGDLKKRSGILQRYGENVVGHFEDHLHTAMIARTPWHEVRQNLIDSSPFLQGAPASWAERIVRTETMYASNKAGNEAIVQADQQLGDACKIISSTFDSRTGADSYAVHGQIRRPSESFQSWFGSYVHPPDRPNDRSVVVPHRVSWPIPAELKPKGYGAVAARWSAEGRKGAPPPQPLMTTIPLDQFGKPPPAAPKPDGEQEPERKRA